MRVVEKGRERVETSRGFGGKGDKYQFKKYFHFTLNSNKQGCFNLVEKTSKLFKLVEIAIGKK